MQMGLALIQSQLPPDTVRAFVAGTDAAVALTENQCVILEPRPCENETDVQRYPLAELTGIRCLRDAQGGLLALEFHKTHSRVVLFAEDAGSTAEALFDLLRCPVKKVIRCGRVVADETHHAAA
jgi:hypothetical protein